LGARLRPERGRKSFLLLFFKKEDISIACLPSPDCPEKRLAESLQLSNHSPLAGLEPSLPLGMSWQQAGAND
jgi:hypothetical protein